MAAAPAAPEVLTQAQWRERAAAHAGRVRPWVAPRLERRRTGRKHPVDDFLFDYYPYSPGRLARWEPGAGVGLEAPVPHLAAAQGFRERDGLVELDPDALPRQRRSLRPVRALLAATAARRPLIGCSALHEWAMVYRVPQEQVRHADWPLRLQPDEVAEVVERLGLRCTHFDAFRFFTPAAVPRNPLQLTRADQRTVEQPGCLHATMDLYKWAAMLRPLLPAELVADTFALARRARELDMRAGPYDLRSLGLAPLLLEEPAGRAEFALLQRDLASAGQELRTRLLAAVDRAAQVLAAEN
jgi:hypothetical protein